MVCYFFEFDYVVDYFNVVLEKNVYKLKVVV